MAMKAAVHCEWVNGRYRQLPDPPPRLPAAPPALFTGLAYSGGMVGTDEFPRGCMINVGGLRWGPLIPLLIDHDWKRPCGWCDGTDIGISGGVHLVVAGQVLPDAFPAAVQVLDEAARGRRWQLSIGVRSTSKDMDVSFDSYLECNGWRVPPWCPITRRGVLKEISFVRAGADPTTIVMWNT